MDASKVSEPTPAKNRATLVRKSDRELVVTRTFNGPAHIVFDAWTQPELLKRWWAPKSTGMALFTCEVVARTGGKYRFVFNLEGHPPMAFFGKYLEVIPNARLVWTNDESDGGPVTTVTFEEKGGKTQLTMSEVYPSKEALDAAMASGMEIGMCETHDQLDELLVTLVPKPNKMKNPTTVERKSDRELVVTRTINGPARMVFEAWTKPELLQRWWVPKSFGLTLHACEADVRVGGKYRFVIGHGDSKPMEFFGRYLEVIPNARLVWTNEEAPDGGPVTTLTFEEERGKTLLVMHELYPSKESLDAAMASGEKSGMHETFEQLEVLLVTSGASVGPS